MPGVNSALNRLKSSRLLAPLMRAVPRSFKVGMRRALDRSTKPSTIQQVLLQTSQTNDIVARMLYEQALTSPRFQEPRRLLASGFKVYSQHDEDGIIEEIFRRIGSTDKYFVEFGVGDGLENCTTYCLLKGWSGVWIDGSAICYEGILRNMAPLLREGRLRVKYSFITAENIEALFNELGVPREFDFLSIDIDRNDYWVWDAIKQFKPRAVAIEYNPSFRHTVPCVVPYSPNAIWEGDNYYGASLKALELLGRKKGYSLVGCNYTGVTAFLVRNDLVGDHFAEPFTAENHYSPARYFVRMPNGHRPAFGPVVLIEPEIGSA